MPLPIEPADLVRSSPVRTPRGRAAAAYDRRWAAYNRRSLDLLRPWIEGRRLGRVLDVGCGTANLVPRLRERGATVERYAGVDPSVEMLRAAEPKTSAAAVPAARISARAGALPFPPGSFDTGVTASSLHAWPDPAAGLRELRRVLRPGGILLLLDWDRAARPMAVLDAWMRATGVRYRRMYAAREIERMLAEAGFDVAGRTRGSAGGLWRLAGFRGVAV